jgi:hypothetical protein
MAAVEFVASKVGNPPRGAVEMNSDGTCIIIEFERIVAPGRSRPTCFAVTTRNGVNQQRLPGPEPVVPAVVLKYYFEQFIAAVANRQSNRGLIHHQHYPSGRSGAETTSHRSVERVRRSGRVSGRSLSVTQSWSAPPPRAASWSRSNGPFQPSRSGLRPRSGTCGFIHEGGRRATLRYGIWGSRPRKWCMNRTSGTKRRPPQILRIV